MVHTVCVHDHLKIATSKINTLTNIILKQLGKMVNKMPALETLHKARKHTTFFL